MEILIVGAGAVGRVYGHHLAKGGARVSVWARPRHEAELRAGVEVHRVLGRKKRERARFVPADVLTTFDAVAARRFDQIWLCVPGDALAEPWTDELLAAAGDAAIVSLQPGSWVKERLARAETLVRGGITIVAWSSPLEGSDDPIERASPPATAYWFPPLARTNFSSDDRAAARAAATALSRGGCPAGVARDVGTQMAFGSAILMPMIAALEAAGWSLSRLRTTRLADGLAGARTMIAITARQLGARGPGFAPLLRAPLAAPLVALARHLVPFDLETYLRFHFSKVGAQTRMMLATTIEQGQTLGVDPAPLAALADAIGQLPPGH